MTENRNKVVCCLSVLFCCQTGRWFLVSARFICITTQGLDTPNSGRHTQHQKRHASGQAPTLSPPQWCCSSASPSCRPCAFPSGSSSSLCTAAEVFPRGRLWSEESTLAASAGHVAGELLSAGMISEAFFSWILLLISFWNLHICSCSSLMKFTTLWQPRRKNREKRLATEELAQRRRRCTSGCFMCKKRCFLSWLIFPGPDATLVAQLCCFVHARDTASWFEGPFKGRRFQVSFCLFLLIKSKVFCQNLRVVFKMSVWYLRETTGFRLNDAMRQNKCFLLWR